MSDTVTEPTFTRITGMDTGPAVWREGWLPSIDVFPELTEARSEYLRLRKAWQSAGAVRADLEARIEADKEQRKASMRDAYLAGDENPAVTAEDETLTAELAEAKEHAQGALSAFLEHINRCIALVIEHRQEWLGQIKAYNASVSDEIEALLEKARELRTRYGNYGRLEHWVERTAVSAAEMPAYHFPYSDIAAPPSGDPDEEEKRLQAFMHHAYAGGFAPDTLISDEQGRKLEKGNEDSLRQPPQSGDTPRAVETNDSGEVELTTLDDDDLVDWLMGTGMFDGQDKPPAPLVVAAAEDDPEMAARLLKAERIANAETPRQEVLDALTNLTSGKAGA